MDMENNRFGNRITDNALKADNGQVLIEKALAYVNKEFGWQPADQEPLFKGVYYDSQKVGSHIVKVINKNNESAVLKLQLRPLPFDEGFIIRHIEKYNSSEKIKTLKIINDVAWSEELGFGFLIFEDVSQFKNLWIENITTKQDRHLHKIFLQEFLNHTLPIEPWLTAPEDDLKSNYKKTFEHFQEIASASSYQHLNNSILEEFKNSYYQIIDNFNFEKFHFTHGHMSGKDIKYNQVNDQFVLMANLYWSFRPKYYELTFPMWVDIMHIRDKNLKLNDVLDRLSAWESEWSDDLFDYNPADRPQYWFNLLERAAMVIMLDLGASEWTENEKEEKAILLSVWQELFVWIIDNKLK